MARKPSRDLQDSAVRFTYEHKEVRAGSRWSAAQAIGPNRVFRSIQSLEWMKKDAALAKAGAGEAVIMLRKTLGSSRRILNFAGQ